MALTCPRCLRALSDSADPAEAPAFCMFCGQQLRDSTAPPAVMPDPALTIDAPTHSFDDDTPETAPLPRPVGEHPKTVGGYDLLRFIGAGGMGTVFEAENAANGQRVAVKLLSGKLASNPASVERFRQEGRVASQISHPHCVFVLGADADAGRPFIVMELMPGKTLKDLVDHSGPLAIADAVTRILDVVAGLAEAHRLGVIHRDVKPSNCFLTDDDRVKVGDFGLSKSLDPSQAGRQITQSGAFLGTVLFASPEQIRGEPVGYESDVYAVCGTLYYLLTGRAPYQHESLTAALAKAVSEPPPPVRKYRAEVPRELERVVLRGLDRDRDRRWASLDELGEALREVLPAGQRPARPRNLVVAYIIDSLILQFAVVPAELLRQWAIGARDFRVEAFDMNWLSVVITVVYFAACEGLWGETPGKRLLRLRVCRLGATGPPGLGRAALRTVVYNALWAMMFMGPPAAYELVRGVPGLALAVVPLLAGFLGLLWQFRRTEAGFRGLHDLASGCRVVQRPRPAHRVRLVSRFPNPLDRVQPTPTPLPATVGGFQIGGKLCDLPDGGEVWAGADAGLGRRVLVLVCPVGEEDPVAGDAVTRPTRLRVVGHGSFAWAGSHREWVAYVAPAGAPLVDIVDPARPLSWAETRPLLEQLVVELESAAADDTAVAAPTVDQVWVEPGGRLQLLDFALPCGEAARGRPAAHQPLAFVREVASLALEGKARADAGRVRAPIPPHASEITDRLFTDGGYRTLGRLRADLIDNHLHPPAVTAGVRATHLAAQAPMLALGLLVMYFSAGLLSLSVAMTELYMVETPRDVRAALADPARAEAVRDRVAVLPDGPNREWLQHELDPKNLPKTLGKLDAVVGRQEAELADAERSLNRPERALVRKYREVMAETTPEVPALPALETSLRLASVNRAPPVEELREALGASMVPAVLAWPFVWAAFAFAFRGGLSTYLAGVRLVRPDGRPAGRFRCAARELLVWAPVTAVLLVALWLQVATPEAVVTRTTVWLFGVLMLPLYVLVALKDPDRAPQDRIMGTHLVPA